MQPELYEYQRDISMEIKAEKRGLHIAIQMAGAFYTVNVDVTVTAKQASTLTKCETNVDKSVMVFRAASRYGCGCYDLFTPLLTRSGEER